MRIGDKRVTTTVTLADGSSQVTPDDDIPFDRIMFERKYQVDWLGWDALREEYLLFMAWVQLNRAALASKSSTLDDYDGWLVSVVSAQFDIQDDTREGDAVLPTDSTASTGV
jgi:hypothetical protein